MTLKELRERFALESGRYDLVNEDGSDNGADFHINAGQRHLDHLTQHTKAVAFNYQLLRPGDAIFYLFNCRTVQSVSYTETRDPETSLGSANSSIMRPLQRMRLASIRSHWRNASRALPQAYCVLTSRGSQDTTRLTDYELFDAMADMADVVMGQYYDKVGILLMPVPNKAINVEVEGMFYTPTLTDDEQESYWSVTHPDLLIQSALRSVEIFHRNTQGVRDWDNSLNASLMLMEHDFVHDESFHVTKMRG